MNTKIHYAFVGGLLLGGCTLSEDQIDTESIDDLDEPTGPTVGGGTEILSESEESIPALISLIPQECIGAAVVAILDDPHSSCMDRNLPPNWIWNPMFDTGSPETTAITLPVPDELQKYCKFEYVGAQKMGSLEDYNPILNFIINHPHLDLTTTAADCMGFQPQATTLNDSDLNKLLAESFLLNIDAPDASDLHATSMYQRPVRLEVIDSVSQTAVDGGFTPHNEHGKYMSALIGSITCPDGDSGCLRQIHHMLALPREDYELPDWTLGEDYASKVDVTAIQVFAAVQQWRQDKINHEPHATDRLVLNISLGYQRVNEGVADFSKGPQASLKAALDFASCHGALVFVASGNVSDEACPDDELGPLNPASFETVLAPTEGECHHLGFSPDWEHDFPIFTGEDRPLVYAIGGVDAYDEPLPNSRPKSWPELVALGANGIGNDGTMPLTGTSVSTAVASATAKLLWAYNPQLRPDEVFFAMYKSAWELGIPADFGIWPGARTRRLSVCAALDYVCSSLDPSECPHLGCEPLPPASDGNLGGFFDGVDGVLDDPGTNLKEDDAHDVPPTCDPALETELVEPQPELPICPHCSSDIMLGSGKGKLYMQIDPAYVGSIASAVFYLKSNTGEITAVPLEPSTIGFLNDPTIGVVVVNFTPPANTKSATVSLWMGPTDGQSNPVALRFVL